MRHAVVVPITFVQQPISMNAKAVIAMLAAVEILIYLHVLPCQIASSRIMSDIYHVAQAAKLFLEVADIGAAANDWYLESRALLGEPIDCSPKTTSRLHGQLYMSSCARCHLKLMLDQQCPAAGATWQQA